MGEFVIYPQTKVKTLKANFKKEFGSTLRVYKGVNFADDDALLATLMSAEGKKNGGDFKVGGNMKVGTFEKTMKSSYGIKVQVANKDNSALVDDNLTLTQSGK